MLSIFSYFSGPSVCFPWRSVYSGLLRFFSWVVCLPGVDTCSLYILEIEPLSEVSIANMFSHTVCSLFNLMLLSSTMQKLFILVRSHLFIFSFMFLALGDISLKILLCGISEIFLPMFSSRTFMVSCSFHI